MRGTTCPLGLPPRSCAAFLFAVLSALALAPALAARPRAELQPDDVYLELLDEGLSRELREADRALRAGRFDEGLSSYERLLALPWPLLREALVPRDLPPTGGRPQPGVIYESLLTALTRRVLALEPEAYGRWKRRREPLAQAALRRALAAGDRDALLAVGRREPGTEAAVAALVRHGDLAYEAGRRTLAAAAYRLAQRRGASLEQGALAARIEAALRPVAARPTSATARARLPARTLLEDGDAEAARALSAVAAEARGALVVPRPYRALLARPGRPVPPPRSLPPYPTPAPDPVPGPLRLQAVASPQLLAIAIAGRPWLEGGGCPAPGERALATRFDLYVFDLRREAALAGSTIEPRCFSSASRRRRAEALRLEWPGGIALVEDRVLCGGVSQREAPELFVGAFDVRRTGLTLRWRTFVCARRTRRSRSDGAPEQLALARAGTTLVLGSSLGVRAGLDPLAGHIRWLVWDPPPDPLGARLPLDRFRLRDPEPPRLPCAIGGRTAHAAAFTVASTGSVEARELERGALRWRVVSEAVCRAVAATDAGLVVETEGTLVLVDPETGKRLSPPVGLPDGARVLGMGAAFGSSVLVPIALETPRRLERALVRLFCLRLSVERASERAPARLAIVAAQPLETEGWLEVSRLGGERAAVVGSDRCYVWPAGGRRWGLAGQLGLLALYDADAATAYANGRTLLRTLAELETARAPFEIAGYRVESEIDPEGGTRAFARLAKPKGRSWVELEREPDGRIRTRVATAPPPLYEPR